MTPLSERKRFTVAFSFFIYVGIEGHLLCRQADLCDFRVTRLSRSTHRYSSVLVLRITKRQETTRKQQKSSRQKQKKMVL
jgi:hypothetical protein